MWISSRRRKHSRRPARRISHFGRGRLESLETRQLLAGLRVSLDAGVLQIVGTDAADQIVIRESAGRITVDGLSGD